MNKSRIGIITLAILIILLVTGVIDYNIRFDLSRFGIPIQLKGILHILILIFSSIILSKVLNKTTPKLSVLNIALISGLSLSASFFIHQIVLGQLGFLSATFSASGNLVFYYILNSVLFGFFGFLLSLLIAKKLQKT